MHIHMRHLDPEQQLRHRAYRVGIERHTLQLVMQIDAMAEQPGTGFALLALPALTGILPRPLHAEGAGEAVDGRDAAALVGAAGGWVPAEPEKESRGVRADVSGGAGFAVEGGFFEKCDVVLLLAEGNGSGEAGDAGADDDDVEGVRGAFSVSRIVGSRIGIHG